MTTQFCTEAEVRRFMSATMALEFADHDADASEDAGVLGDAIDWASEEIESQAGQRYSAAGLSSSKLINRWCVLLSACNLAITRGNPMPESWDRQRDEVLANLEKVAAGNMRLAGVSLKSDLTPSFSNLTVDRRFHRSTIRVTTANSSSQPTEKSRDRSIDYGTDSA